MKNNMLLILDDLRREKIKLLDQKGELQRQFGLTKDPIKKAEIRSDLELCSGRCLEFDRVLSLMGVRITF